MCLIKYDKDNIGKYFLSPYVCIQEYGGAVTFCNHIFETRITLTDFSKYMSEFLDIMHGGSDEERLLEFFKGKITVSPPEEVLSLFLNKGVII